MLNRIVLIGRLTADPQLRYTQSGTAVATFRLAVDRNRPNQQGEREADFIDIVTWQKLAETCSNNLNKGRLVAVDGRLQVREYEYEGQRRRVAEVVAETVRFLDWPKDGSGQQSGGYSGGQQGSGYSGGQQGSGYSGGQQSSGYGRNEGMDDFMPDDDVPF